MSQNILSLTFYLLRRARANWWHWLSSKTEPGSRMSSRCATNSGIFQNFNCALFFILAWLTATFNHTLTLPCHNWCTDQILESLVGYSIYHLFERDITYPYHDIVVTTGVEQYYYIILNDTTQNHSEQSIFAQRSLLNSSFFFTDKCRKIFSHTIQEFNDK